ncbi:MAG: ribonuclease HII [Calditrichaeota bacterium]|nr:ribonuclease HII [Calditrichota bacterium]
MKNILMKPLKKTNLLKFERALWKKGYRCIAGIDEAGRGPLAGPVVAAAVVFPRNQRLIPQINDSKKLSPQKRLIAKKIIEKTALAIGVGIIPQSIIDEINILQATYCAMKDAVFNLNIAPDYTLVDGRKGISLEMPFECLVKGDARSMSIAAASIIAKVTRDQIMIDYEKMYPGYGFAQHKGYPTKMHVEAIRNAGLTPIHRRSFRPKQLLDIYEAGE